MRSHRATALAAVALTILALAALRAPADLDSSRFVPIEELKPGDQCVGRTVFSGTEIEEFGVEILGVVRGASPGADLIIARASGELLEKTGVLEGMSGSPVYMDGRLVGAIASTWAFTKEPIAGITPIAEMLPALDMFDDDVRVGERPGRALLVETIPLHERASSSIVRIADVAGPRAEELASLEPAGTFRERTLLPIAAPLVVSGADDSFVASVSRVLGSAGLSAVRGTGGGATNAGATLEPGSAVGVQFVGGDANWTAIGTVTHVEGDRLVAFGHPLFNSGSIEMPMVSAFVHTVMPLQSISFKYASGGEVLGAMREDRSRVVAGLVGAAPPTIPLAVNVRADGVDRRYEFDVVSSRRLSPIFAGLALGGAVSGAARAAGPASVELRARVDTGDEIIDYSDTFYTTEPAMRLSGELSILMAVISENAFEDKRIEGAEVDVTLAVDEPLITIERVDADRAVYSPGDDIRLTVVLRPLRGEPFERHLVLPLPLSARRGNVVVRVGGATAFHQWNAERLGFGIAPRNFEQLVDLIERLKPGNTLVAQALSDDPGFSLSGEEMRDVPGRAVLAMASSASSGAVDTAVQSVLAESELSFDRQVAGYHEISVSLKTER